MGARDLVYLLGVSTCIRFLMLETTDNLLKTTMRHTCTCRLLSTVAKSLSLAVTCGDLLFGILPGTYEILMQDGNPGRPAQSGRYCYRRNLSRVSILRVCYCSKDYRAIRKENDVAIISMITAKINSF